MKVIDQAVSVYVIAQRPGEHIKVGVAANPQKRLRQLATASPTPLILLHCTKPKSREFTGQVECRVHSLLADFRALGEWFRCTPEQAIDAIVAAERWVKNRRADLSYSPAKRRLMNLGVER